MANFEKALAKTINYEGAYSNDLDDSGGKTKYGITETVAKRNGWDFENMSFEDIKYAYKTIYWDALNCENIENQELAEEIFDFGVNCGVGTAGKAVQTALNLLNRNNLNWFDLIIDGLIGKKTLEILNSLSIIDIEYFKKILKGERYIHYRNVSLKYPKNEKFFRGWINRIW